MVLAGRAKVSDPIAIVGMGCRLPGGVSSPADFWQLLVGARDAIVPIPAERWNGGAYFSATRSHPGKVIHRQGGFLEGIDLFEPRFFGISEAEAPYIDPQHRLLLEVTWEAFERAGLILDECRGSPVGVFIGCFSADYLHMQFADPYDLGPFTATGALATMAAARISHTFDFRGPAMTVDTACSSSLHCVHLACESLRAGDSDIAVAGGSQLMLIPEFNIAETKAGFLSSDSQCRSFDADARGYVRSEGVGVVVLKRLADAIAAGDPVQAVILGSAVNQDGRTPSIAQPRSEAQQHVMRRACQRAGIAPEQVCYVEAHGTGTSAGDRAEAEAIGTVFRLETGNSTPVLVGSCKSNIGHTEAAAGIAGLIKTSLCVQHGAAPPNLHFENPNPAIGFEYLRIRVPRSLEQLPDTAIACVNSFGFGGSNAAVVLSAHRKTAPPTPHAPERSSFILPVSAQSAASLAASLATLEHWVPQGLNLSDLCYTAAVRRSHHEVRRTLVFSDETTLRESIRSALQDGCESLSVDASAPGVVWVFSGAGNQRYQTGLRLFQAEPVFRQMLEQCDAVYHRLAGFSLIDVMRSGAAGEFIQEAWLAHPVTVSIQLGLAALYRSWGVEPAAIVGHSLGENAAFCVAGVYDLEHSLEIAFHRCECLKPLHGTGGLLAVAADRPTIAAALGSSVQDCSVAAENGPASLTLSLRHPDLESVRQQLEQSQIRCHLLSESFACHHPYPALEVAVEELERRLQGIAARAPATLLISTATGSVVETAPKPSYWSRHLLESVKLQQAISMLAGRGYRRFLEIGPYPALAASVAATLNGGGARVISALRAGLDETSSVLRSIGALYESGAQIDWKKPYPSGNVLDLPTYEWQRTRFWREPATSLAHRQRTAVAALLGGRVSRTPPAWRSEICAERLPFLLDHRIAGQTVFPAAAYIDMALSAGREHFAGQPFAVEDVRFLKAVPLTRASAFFMDFQLEPSTGAFAIYTTHSLTDRAAERVAEGRLRGLPPGALFTAIAPALPDVTPVFPEQLYERFARARYEYRDVFRGIERAYVSGDEAWCEIALPSEVSTAEFSFHPAALDAAFQSLLCIRESGPLELPDRIGSIRLFGTPGTGPLSVWARIREVGTGHSGELRIFDASRNLIAHISGFVTRTVQRSASVDECLYRTEWQRCVIPSPASPRHSGTILVTGDLSGRFAPALLQAGAEHVISCPDSLECDPSITRVVYLETPNQNGTSGRALLPLVRALANRANACKLSIVTRGAYQITGADPPPDPFQAASWGFARAIGQRELPRLWGGLFDVSRDCTQSEIDVAARSILLGSEDQLAFRGADSYALRLRRAAAERAPAPQPRFRSDAAYLVTGASGALGSEVARWMILHGARRLILPTRRTERSPLIDELESAGAKVEAPRLDLSDLDELASYCEDRKRQDPPIRGIIHCAGRSVDRLVTHLDAQSHDAVFDVKALGAWTLHQSLLDTPLEHFVLFSSIASVLPNPGMASYAAANAFLDALAIYRRSLGLPALSIGWGPWESGMTERDGIKTYLERAGLHCFTAPQGIHILERLWFSTDPNPMAVSIDWQLAANHAYPVIPLLNELLQENSHDCTPTAVTSGHLEHRLRVTLTRLIPGAKTLDSTVPLVDQGLDSLSATVRVERLYREFNVDLEPDALAGISLRDLLQVLTMAAPV